MEKTLSENPCQGCEHFEKLNRCLLETILPPSAENEFQDWPGLEKALKQAQENCLKCKTLFQMAPDAILIADAETGILLEANEKAAQLLGIPADGIVGMHQSQLHPIEEREYGRKLFQEHAQKKSLHCTEDVYICNRDGEKIPVQISTSVILFDNQKIIMSIFRDLTEQKKLQQHLAQSERKYTDLYKDAQVALYRTRISDGKPLDCNRAAAMLLGYADEDELINLSSITETYADPEQREQFLEALRKNQKIQNFQLQLKRRDGSPIWVSISAEIFPETDSIEGMMVDITMSKVLSKNETAILDLIMQGKGNKEIAYMTDRSIRTIEDHRANIMKKLGADNIVELTQIAMKSFNSDQNHDDPK